MMKPKEYLLSIGAIKEITRGRLSLDNIERCKAAAADGVAIEGYEVSKKAATSTAPATVIVEKRNPVKASEISARMQSTFDENAMVVHAPNGDVIGNRTVCDTCNHSLSWHICDEPKVMHDGACVPVVISVTK